MSSSGTPSYSLPDLLRVMERLRDPETGCPWDLQQDFRSIVPSTLEECYELAHAIEQDDFEHIAEELGDVLFQVVFYAQLGRERDLFSFEQVVSSLVEKLVRRHPHVFAGGRIEGIVQADVEVGQVNATWEAIKQEERGARALHGALDDVPVALPALPRAQKLQKRAARTGFDWADSAGALKKLEEELEELRSALATGNTESIGEEMGDLLFSCVNVCRHLRLDAERTLRDASSKFERRFRYMEAAAASEGLDMSALDDAALDALWERAKGA